MSAKICKRFPAATPSDPNVFYRLSVGDVSVITAFNERQIECAKKTAEDLARRLGELRALNLGELATFLEDYAREVRARGICQ